MNNKCKFCAAYEIAKLALSVIILVVCAAISSIVIGYVAFGRFVDY